MWYAFLALRELVTGMWTDSPHEAVCGMTGPLPSGGSQFQHFHIPLAAVRTTHAQVNGTATRRSVEDLHRMKPRVRRGSGTHSGEGAGSEETERRRLASSVRMTLDERRYWMTYTYSRSSLVRITPAFSDRKVVEPPPPPLSVPTPNAYTQQWRAFAISRTQSYRVAYYHFLYSHLDF